MMLKKFVLVGLASLLLSATVPAQAGHDVREGGYFTAGVFGDSGHTCETEEILGFCLGGYAFEDLDSGNWRLAAEDDISDVVSGAYQVEGSAIVDVCLDGSASADDVPQAGRIVVWIDGVVFWAQGQPCGLGVLSQGTFGTISATHL